MVFREGTLALPARLCACLLSFASPDLSKFLAHGMALHLSNGISTVSLALSLEEEWTS